MTQEQANIAARNVFTQVYIDTKTNEYYVAVFDGDGIKIGEIRDQIIND